jgi:acyl-[acyl carrier protein]--UDP-N-acetylglucosamine O-acyltransferase
LTTPVEAGQASANGVGSWLTIREQLLVAVVFSESLTETVIGNVPVWMGIPEIAPDCGESERP